jgi:2-phosphosulfolactate phosphatase
MSPGIRPVFTGTAQLTRTPAVAVVIDVMRAFTTAAWAFGRGAEKIVFARTLDEALELKARHPGWLALQDGPPVPGFDLANSPAQLRTLDVRGRTVVQKTTAGTVGALAVAEAEVLLCASFAVAQTTADVLRRRAPDDSEVTFVVTGEDGRAVEDLACAEYIAARATGSGPTSATYPAPFVERARNSAAARNLAEGVRHGHRGIHAEDVTLCLEVDTFPFAMAATREGPHIVLRPTGTRDART